MLRCEAFGQLHGWDVLLFQAEGTMANSTESVNVVAMVVMMIPVCLVVLHAEAIFAVSATVFESVEQTVFFKKGEGTEDAATVHIGQ